MMKNIKKFILFITVWINSLCTVFASSQSDDFSVKKGMDAIISIVTTIFQCVGIFLLAWGIIQFILSIKRTDAESKSDAITTIICGIVLTSIKFILTQLTFYYGGVGI